jgi:hypothetical protein
MTNIHGKLVAREEDLGTYGRNVPLDQEQLSWQAPAVAHWGIILTLVTIIVPLRIHDSMPTPLAVVENISFKLTCNNRTRCNQFRVLKDDDLNFCGQVHEPKRRVVLTGSASGNIKLTIDDGGSQMVKPEGS